MDRRLTRRNFGLPVSAEPFRLRQSAAFLNILCPTHRPKRKNGQRRCGQEGQKPTKSSAEGGVSAGSTGFARLNAKCDLKGGLRFWPKVVTESLV